MASGSDDTDLVSQTITNQETSNSTTANRNGHRRSQPIVYATEGDWATHRAEIQRLYMDEELPLKEVIHTMKEKHSFHATYSAHQPPGRVLRPEC